MSSPWIQEAFRLSVWLGLGCLLGALVDHVLVGVLMASLIFTVYQLRQMSRFEQWSHSKLREPLKQNGGWGDLSYTFVKMHGALQKTNRSQKQKLGVFLKNFRESTQALPDPVVLLNERDEVEWFNKSAESLLGLNHKDKGQIVSNIIRTPEFATLLHHENGSSSLEMRSPLDDAKILELRLVEIKNRRLLLARDISHVHRLMTMRQQFVGNVSHELRTPLTVILGYLEMMADDETLGDAHRNQLSKMLGPALRMKSIVGDLLTLSVLDTAEPPVLDKCTVIKVASLLKSLLSDMERLSNGRHQIKPEIQSNLLLRAVDSEIYSVFTNLISNAIRYTPDGGCITVRWVEQDGKALFEVEDEGIGIAPEHLPRLMERFYRVDVGRSRDKGGTGLGLAIVKQILRRHDSQLLVWSEVGKGSCFSCLFPEPRVLKTDSSVKMQALG